ncbi:unnamed protein product [Closterium sp. NIES-65]|nr:unnamed protein product [Closterium sp. NIES-65]
MPWVMLHLSTSSHPHFRALRFNHTPVEALSAAAGEKGQGSGGEGGGKVGGIVGGSGWGVRKGEVWRPRRGEGVCELGRGDWQMEREGYPLNGRTGFDYLHFAWRESECAHPFTLTHAPLSHPHLQPQENGRTDFDYLHFAWRESDCAHPFTRFRADRFFEAFQNRRIVFVGDSTLLSMFQSLLCLLSVGPSLPPNHSMPTERLNRTFPSLLHPPSSSPSLLSSYSSSPLTSSSSSSSAASPAGSKSQASTPLVFQYTFPHANTSLDFFHSDFLTVLESAPSHAPGQSDTPAPDTPPASMAVPDTPNPSLTKNMHEGINNSSINATNIVASFGSSSNAGIGRSLLTDTSETTQEPGSDGLNAVELGSDRSGAAKPSSEGLGAVRVVRLDAWAAYVVAAQPHVLVIHTGGAWVGLQQRWQEHRARIHASQEGQKGQEGQEGQEGQSAANESKVFAAVAGKGVEGGMREEKVGAEGKVEVGGGKRKAGGGKGEPGGGKGEVGGGNWKAGGGKGEPGGGKGEPGGGKGEVGGGKGKAGGGNGEPGGGKGEVGGGKGKAGGGKGEPGGGTGGNGGGNKGTGEKAKGKGGGKKGNGGEKRGNGGEKKGSGGEKKGSGGENRGNGGENRGNGGENRGNGGENKGNGGGNRGNGGENRGNGGENKGNGRENRGNGGENKGNGGEKKGNGGGKKGNGGGKKGNGGGKKGNGGGKKGNSGGNGVDGWKNKGSGGGKQGNGGGYQGNGGGYQGNGGGNQGNGGGSKEAGQGNDGGNGGKGGGSKEVGQGNQGNGAGRKGNSVGDNKISAGSKGNGGMALGDNSKAGQKGGGTGKQAGSEMKKAGGKGESSGDKAKEKRKAVAEVQKTGGRGGGGGKVERLRKAGGQKGIKEGERRRWEKQEPGSGGQGKQGKGQKRQGKGQGKQGEGKRQKVGEKVEEGVMKQGGDNGGQTASGGGGGDTTSGSQTDPFAGGELRMGDFGDDDAILQGDSIENDSSSSGSSVSNSSNSTTSNGFTTSSPGSTTSNVQSSNNKSLSNLSINPSNIGSGGARDSHKEGRKGGERSKRGRGRIGKWLWRHRHLLSFPESTESVHREDDESDSFRSHMPLILTPMPHVDSPASAGNMSILDGMDGADEAGSLGSMDGSDAAEGGSGEAVGGSKLEEGDVRLEEEEQQTGGSFMADEADIVLEEMSEASSSVGRGSFLDEDRPVENDEVPEQQQQQGGSVMADEADQVQEEMSQGRLSEGEVMPSVNQVTFDEEGEAAKEDAVQEKDNESHVVTGAENDKEVRGEDVHNEAANKEDESPGGPSVLPPNLLDSVDFLDPVAAFTKTLRMLHHFLSSQPTAESLPTFFLGLPREHYFRADQGNHTSLCLPDDVTCKENGQCSLFSRPREWLEEGGEEQAHQQRWQRWRWRQERERRERRREWVHSSVGQMERVVEREIGMGDRVVLLQAGGLTDARVDAHVGSSLPAEMRVGETKKEDCSHFCVPGVPDTWNEMLVAALRLQEMMT